MSKDPRDNLSYSDLRPADQQRLRSMVAEGADRRQVMRWMMASGATAAAAGAIALGASKAHAQTPKKGGHYRAGIHDGNTTDSLDPATFSGVGMIQLAHTNRNFLTELDQNDEVMGELAESWEATKDAKEWTLTLRQGVEFHNGKTFTAEDVVDSLNHHRGEETKSAAKALLESIEEIKADGDGVIRVKLSQGNADFPYVLTDYHLPMCPSNGDGTIDVSGVGTGAYKIEEFEPGVRTYLTKNENYWKEDRGHFDEVTMLILRDGAARSNALVTGEIDAVTEVETKSIRLLKRRKDIEVDEVPSGTHTTLPMFVDTAPFDDVNVRLALKYSMDRQQALDKAISGQGVLGNDHPIGPNMPFHADLPQREYDIDKAKFHLKKAGLTSLDIDLSASDGAFLGAVDLALLFKESAAPAGININVQREPADGYWSNVWLKKPFCVVSWGGRPTPDVIFSLAYQQGAAWNESRWENERFNALLSEAKSELDQAKRTEMYAEMQTLCRDDGGTIVPFFRNRVLGHNTSIAHGEKLTSSWELDGARSAERWWFA